MFVRAFTLVLAIAASSIALPGDSSSQCDTGGVQCCTQTMDASQAAGVLGLLGLGSVQGLVGMGCSPLGVVQAGSGAECSQQPVCCTDFNNVGNQLVGVNCSPVNVNF